MAEFDPSSGHAPSEQSMTQDEKNLCILVHILAIFTCFIGPLIIWLLKKDESKVVGAHALEALNFSITIAIAFAVCFVLTFVIIGALLMPIVWVFAIVNYVLGAVAASKGQFRPYPLTIRLLK